MQPSEAESSKIASTLGKSNPQTTEPPKKKRRGPKGPNPLSVKKKKPKIDNRQVQSGRDESGAGTKRKRSNDDEGDVDTREWGGAMGGRTGAEAVSKGKRRRNRKRRRTEGDNTNKSDPGVTGHPEATST